MLNSPATYMKLRGYPANLIVECAVCPKQFPACEGVAFPASTKSHGVVMAAFCCNECYLGALPPESMGRA